MSGRLIVYEKDAMGADITIGEVRPEEPVGEMQVLTGGRRTATVRAMMDSQLLMLPPKALEDLLKENPRALRQMSSLIKQRLRKNLLLAILPGLFGGLEEKDFKDIEEISEWVHLLRGETLFNQGDPGDSLYIVVSGRLRAIMHDGSNWKSLGEIQSGEFVGEMGLFSGEPRSADVHAIRDSELVRFSQSAFDYILAKYPMVMLQVSKNIIKRLRNVEGVRPQAYGSTNIVILSADGKIDISDFVKVLCSCFDRPVLHLSAKKIDEFLSTPEIALSPEKSPNSMRIAAFLDEKERQYAFILYETDPHPSPWTRRCLHQGDHVLIVAAAGGDVNLGPIEKRLYDSGDAKTAPHKALVVVHPVNTDIPQGTHKWFVERKLDSHYHVRRNNRSDFRRLVRFLTGESVGLVFGGGGARGYAHVGIIQAFEETGISIDRVAGTSMGSIIAALCAMELTPDEIIRNAKNDK